MLKKLYKLIFLNILLYLVILSTGCFFTIPIDNNYKGSGVTELFVDENVQIERFEDDKNSFLRNNILNDNEKLIYDVVYNAMKSKMQVINFDSLTGYFASESEMKSLLSNAVFSVLRDHPELFVYNSGYTYEYNSFLDISSLVLNFDFNMDLADSISMQKEIDEVVDDILIEIKDFDEYEKSKYVYTYLAQNTVYAEGNNINNMYGPLVDGISKCDGYARAYLYIMQRCGMEAGYISGYGKNEPHAWNAVKIDGLWYFVDCTWGDPIVETDDPEIKSNNVDYSYLHLSTEDILKTHKFDSMYKKLPEFTENHANYHIKEAYYFDAFNESDLIELISNDIKNANINNNKFKFDIKYSNYEEMKKAYDWLEGDNVMSLAENIDCYAVGYYKWESEIGALSIELNFKF